MNQLLAIAKKELRTYFVSPVALIFVASFLVAVLFAFFWGETFFRRNVADTRPLFEWLPLLLIPLTAALTMRLWSDEQRAGTLEILLTMPVQVHRLVLGKFLAGMALVAIALVLTLGLPITVSMLGDLDWGPVFGGYLAALLVAAAYLAIGLCISSGTQNGVVALLLTGFACVALYLVGSEGVLAFANGPLAELLSSLGTASRFRSIQRGVIDLRDLVYYGSLTVGFLFLNVVLLEAKRWSVGKGTQARRRALVVAAGLVVANLLLLNLNLAGVRGARIDLTERSEYSISPATTKILRSLDAPLLIRGYFSKKTHQLLAPLVPKIRDMLEEYDAVGGPRVHAEFLDPRDKPGIEKEANESYGIKSMPFQFAERHRAGIVNAYFHILIKYGDKHTVLSFDKLIEARATGIGKVEVKLRNLEYDLTRSIKKLAVGFTPLEDVFARAGGKVELVGYITEKTLPKNVAKLPKLIAKVAKELGARSGGKLNYRTVDPSGEAKKGLRQQLFERYRFRPMSASLFSNDYFYLHLLARVGEGKEEKIERIYPSFEMGEGELKKEISAAFKRLVPGFLKTVGVVAEKEQPRMNPMMMRMGRRPPPPRDKVRLLKTKLSENYQTRDVSLASGRVPGDIDVLLIIGGHGKLDEKSRFAIDQYLMRGGAVIVMVGRYALSLQGGSGLGVKKVESPLFGLLSAWGVEVQPSMVLDKQNEAFPVPVEREVMGYRVREIQLLDYPYWIDVRPDGMAEGSPVVAGLPSTTLQWASPLSLSKRDGVETTVLLRSSATSWTETSTNVQPDFKTYPKKGFGVPKDAKLERRPLAVLARGGFPSAFKGKASPLFADKAPAGAPKGKKPSDAELSKRKASRVIARAPKQARLAVIGTADMVDDQVLSISRQSGGERFINNLRLVQNLVDWAVADTDLLSIRSRGTYARTLRPLEPGEGRSWETINYLIALLGLGLLLGLTWFWRKGVKPLALPIGSERAEKKEGGR
ncbi:MAG: ABC transporter permease [Proteobacteria bacterium]|nr:MAG: ABC transporter permease [Pseudomonadota bacterium]